jgi:hypothetical protein
MVMAVVFILIFFPFVIFFPTLLLKYTLLWSIGGFILVVMVVVFFFFVLFFGLYFDNHLVLALA